MGGGLTDSPWGGGGANISSTSRLEDNSKQFFEIKFPFKRKACQVYEGGCCRQVSICVWWYDWQVDYIKSGCCRQVSIVVSLIEL